MENKMLHNGSTWLTAQKAERDQDTSGQQLNKDITSHQRKTLGRKKKKKTEQIWIGRGSCFSVKCIIMPKTTTRISGRVTLAKLFLKLQMEDKSRVGATEIGSRTISNGPNKSQFRPIQSNHWVDRRRPKEKQAPKILRARLRAPLGFNNITYAFMEWKKQIQSRGEQMAAAAAFSHAMRHCGDDD